MSVSSLPKKMPVTQICVSPATVPTTPLLSSRDGLQLSRQNSANDKSPLNATNGSLVNGTGSPDGEELSVFVEEELVFNCDNEKAEDEQSIARLSIVSTLANICRICHCEEEPGRALIAPCHCAGTLKFVHEACLRQWIKCSDTKSCELCRYNFSMTAKVIPFRKWRKMSMTSSEERKILCSVSFHVIAITCVVWSLYVLIDRTADEIEKNLLEWPFWTKLIVVAVGFTGGVVFMYVQCKMYVQLFRRWKTFNKIIEIQECPPALTGRRNDRAKGIDGVSASVDV